MERAEGIRHFAWHRVGSRLVVMWALARLAPAESAREFDSFPYPLDGDVGPHTYVADSARTSCRRLQPYPSTVPWDPSISEAEDFCSSLPQCGGFLFTTKQAAVAPDGVPRTQAVFCFPQSINAGTASANSAIAFTRKLYRSCDVRARLPVAIPSFHGAFQGHRRACIRLGRGLGRSPDRTPKPNLPTRQGRPQKTVRLDGTDYVVGSEVFRDQEEARRSSGDGTSHHMASESGIIYHMAGMSHASRHESLAPFALDGYFPLYGTKASAQAASLRAGGNGQASSVGPISDLGHPARWTIPPHAQTYYIPLTAPVLYLGDFMEAFALDGYFPLFRSLAAAQKASTDGTAQSHGPGGTMGHPLSWSTGEHTVFYMPSAGHQQYFGNYLDAANAEVNGELYSGRMSASRVAGLGQVQAAAAQAIAAAGMQANTAAAAATLAAAPAHS